MGEMPLIKHVKLSARTHKRLRALQVEWELRTIDDVVTRLLSKEAVR